MPAAPRGPYGRERDRSNRVDIEPVETDGLRLEVELEPGTAPGGARSGGILEWRVIESR